MKQTSVILIKFFLSLNHRLFEIKNSNLPLSVLKNAKKKFHLLIYFEATIWMPNPLNLPVGRNIRYLNIHDLPFDQNFSWNYRHKNFKDQALKSRPTDKILWALVSEFSVNRFWFWSEFYWKSTRKYNF
jgi:hypothetical protein